MRILKRFHAWRINKKQEEVNRLKERDGFTDEVLEKQVAINKKRAKHNIVDGSKIVHKKYVQ